MVAGITFTALMNECWLLRGKTILQRGAQAAQTLRSSSSLKGLMSDCSPLFFPWYAEPRERRHREAQW